MKLSQTLLVLPMGFALLAGDTPTQDKSKHNAKQSTVKQSNGATDGASGDDKSMKRQTEGHRPQDLNGDGFISRNEWPGSDASFRELDSDGDGLLTKKDRVPAVEGTRGRMYDRTVNDYSQPPKKNQPSKR